MLYFNVLSSDGFSTIQWGRFEFKVEAEALAAKLRAQGIDAYVAPWRAYA